MKAYRITSTEYCANIPDVFMMTEDGLYYGDRGYPNRDGFPKDVEHWKTAACSDVDRRFKVEEIDVPDSTMRALNEIDYQFNQYKRWMNFAKDETEKDKLIEKNYALCFAARAIIKNI